MPKMTGQIMLLLLAIFGIMTFWYAGGQLFVGMPNHRILAIDTNLTLPQGLDFSANRSHHEWYASPNAQEFCRAHGYAVFKPNSESGQRKVYDLIMANTELDFLEIRLATMYDHVDYFIVVEASKTFQGRPKDLTIKNNWDRLKVYHDKMIYHELEYPPGFHSKITWDYENLQRNAMYNQVFPTLTGDQVPIKGDVILVADVDEIIRPVTLLTLRTCAFPRRLTLASKFYYYSFQYLHTGPEWQHPQATFYTGNSTILPADLRDGIGGVPILREVDKGVLGNAAWHCSSCFATVDEFLTKMASFSHMSMNKQKFRDRHRIANAVREGKDLWERKQDVFVRVEENIDVPRYLLENGDRFRYMLNRDGDSAGFQDYP